MSVHCCRTPSNLVLVESPLSSDVNERDHKPHVPPNNIIHTLNMSLNHPPNDASPSSSRTRLLLGAIDTPSMIAPSPVCTPGVSVPLDLHLHATTDSSKRSPPRSLLEVKHCPPTWISTPPTPPPELVRRSVTCRTRRSPSLIITPSASLPDPRSSHAPARIPKRRASIAAMYTWRLRSSSDASPGLKNADHEAFVRVSSPLRSTLLVPFEYSDESTSSTRSRPSVPIFHIPNDPGTDTEEGGAILSESPVGVTPPLLPHEHPLVTNRDKGQTTDNMRRLYGLLELLTTEVGYLSDLRALVSIYLRQLPLLAIRPLSRSHSSFSAISRVSSFTYLGHPSTLAQSLEVNSGTNKEKDHSSPRPLFSELDIELLSRNVEEILELHEYFVKELRTAVGPYGLSNALDESDVDSERQYPESYERMSTNAEAAIKAVCTKFATESSRFNAYQSFCASHPEALDLIRRVQQQYPLEWHDFEYRCSIMISSLAEGGTRTDAPSSRPPSPEEAAPPRKRTSSLTSIDGAVRTLRSKAGLRTKDSFVFPTETQRDPAKSPHRLAFMDYMIKPVQRICKYPLLLDQLSPGKHISAPTSRKTDVHVVVESATQAMRHVASSVDEARHKQDVAIQSTLIMSRLTVLSSLSHGSQTSTPPQALTHPFMASLGTCLLAGPLDVIHHQFGKSLGSRGKIRSKYLGAFLYMGGYFILVKVAKGKAYDPRHWLSLADFDIINVREDEALLPFSFRFISNGHQFELAASCHAEKEAWLKAIQHSMTQAPKWLNEPIPSIHCDGKGELVPSSLDGGPFETINALPTIQSIPELINNDSANSTESAPAALPSEPLSPPSREDLPPASAPPSRRSSATSVRSIFSPLTPDFTHFSVSRPSAAAKAVVEQGMHDVISEPCISARSRASLSEEDLFHPPTITRRKSRSSLTMSSIGLGKNRTMNDNVHIFRRRSLLEGSDTLGRKSASRTKSLAIRRQAKKLPLISTFDPGSSSFEPSSSRPSPIPIKHISSSSNPPSASSSPLEPQTPPIILKDDMDKASKPHRHLVGSMREFFHPRSASPVLTSTNPDPEDDDLVGKTITPNLLKRWAQGTINSHRRAHSAPDDESSLAQPPEHFDTHCEIHVDAKIITKTPDTQVTPPPEEGSLSNIAPRNTHKRMSLFQRLKSIEVG